MPIARAMPSSERRSAESITKIRKMSRIPAAIEKLPKVVKIETKTSLTWSAASRPSCLAFCSSSPSGASAGAAAATTLPVAPAPEVSSPRLETSTWRICVGRPSRRCAPSSGISTDAPSLPVPSYSTTPATRAAVARRSESTLSRSPARAPSASAASPSR